MGLWEKGLWAVRFQQDWVTPEQLRAFRAQHITKAFVETAKMTGKVVGSCVGGFLMPWAAYVGYTVSHRGPPNWDAAEGPSALLAMGVLSGLFFASLSLRNGCELVEKHLVTLYNPRKSTFHAFKTELRELFDTTIRLMLLISAIVLPFYLGGMLIQVLLLP